MTVPQLLEMADKQLGVAIAPDTPKSKILTMIVNMAIASRPG